MQTVGYRKGDRKTSTAAEAPEKADALQQLGVCCSKSRNGLHKQLFRMQQMVVAEAAISIQCCSVQVHVHAWFLTAHT